MCGIGGFSLTDTNDEAPELMRSMALALVPRGHHASGYGWLDPADDWPWHWNAEGSAYDTFEEAPLQATHTAVVHTRYATQGDPSDPLNNHPLAQPGIVLVHNGTLSNDDELFDRYPNVERHGEVDSEAIAAILSGDERHPAKVLGQVRGRMAIAWLDTVTGSLHLARGQGSPLVVGQNEAGDFVFASTAELLHRALKCERWFGRLVWQQEVPEGCYLRVVRGRVVEWDRFEVKQTAVARRLTLMTEGGR